MSYDPEDFRVGWRDIGAGYLLSVIVFLGLLALGIGGSAGSSGTHPANTIANTSSATCTEQACEPGRVDRASSNRFSLPSEEWEEDYVACGSKRRCAYF